MLYQMKTEEGSIGIGRDVITRIIIEVVEQFQGKVLISNAKGKLLGPGMRLVGVGEGSFIELEMGKQGLDIRLNIVIRFGTSISMVTEQLIIDIKENIEKYTGIEVNSTAVVVAGLLSKQMTRRNIEVRG
ncbi:MAG: Asp23/Gls24 family envelope stress response protein [Bacillota bacterium]|nr:Asp23/Gls24 family envelope stress response protein [Bacillota bacterium]